VLAAARSIGNPPTTRDDCLVVFSVAARLRKTIGNDAKEAVKGISLTYKMIPF